ncbi:hypothetical protein Anae109_3675 [Anaeromyxobacter sp. Fw109-5]|nr:hypothetical protein Anae109_3675 [Anaeromyxobacter sp. Fw109-5]
MAHMSSSSYPSCRGWPTSPVWASLWSARSAGRRLVHRRLHGREQRRARRCLDVLRPLLNDGRRPARTGALRDGGPTGAAWGGHGAVHHRGAGRAARHQHHPAAGDHGGGDVDLDLDLDQ